MAGGLMFQQPTKGLEFTAHFEPESARKAARAFFVRLYRELRFWTTITPPFVFAVALAFTSKLHPRPTLTIILLCSFLALSILYPPVYYFLLPWVAARRARKTPTWQVRLRNEAIEVDVNGRVVRIAWNRFRHVWRVGDYVYLLISPYASIKLPLAGMPDEARQFIFDAARRAGAKVDDAA